MKQGITKVEFHNGDRGKYKRLEVSRKSVKFRKRSTIWEFPSRSY
ncbi:MAG: hypothetical protein ACLTGN_07700 [Clostridium sp.]